ncbi:MAG: serine/threonine-protein kinase [Planctomycetota bacterium]|nr:serine/threonine-protein kinase [Planctomycetota bacterium]
MSTASTRGNLFASFARRLGYVTDGPLDLACQARRRDPSRELADILVAQGAIDDRNRALIEEIVESHLALHAGNAEACFAGILDKGWVPAALLADGSDPPTAAGAPMGLEPPVVAWQEGNADALTETVTLGSYTSGGSRYELLERKFSGGMGEVWIARDRELNREVLLKQVLPKLAENVRNRGRFLREARTGAILEHPGIVPVYDIGQHPGGQLFQVMRYFRPGSLHKKIAAYHLAHPDALDELAFRTLLGHFATACRAIEFAHTRGILHLDIKPQNIVTGDFGETQIIDWGLAQITDADMLEKVHEESGNLASGSAGGDSVSADSAAPASREKPAATAVLPRGLRGTPAYAAPEQWKGDPQVLGPWTDVYGLGATLFEILAGKAPFKVPSPTLEEDVEIGNLHRDVKPWVPANVRAICCKAMAVKPGDRYATAAALADDIERFLADEPVAAWPDPWRVRLWRFVKRHRTAVAAAGMLLATTTVALAIGNVLVARERDAKERARQEAVAQRDLAERNAAMTRDVIADFIETVADDKWGSIPGTGQLRLDAVQSVVDKFPDLIAQQPDNPDLKYDAALIYRRCANLYRVLGKLNEAKPLYEKSRGIMEKLVAEKAPKEYHTLGWIHHLLDEAEVILRTDGPQPSIATFRKALEQAELAVKSFPNSPGPLWTLGRAEMDLADALVDAGSAAEGAEQAATGVTHFEAAMARDGEDDEDIRYQTRLMASLAAAVAANASFEAGRPDREMAEKADRWSAELSENLAGDPNVDFVRALALDERARVLGLDAATAAEGEKLGIEAVVKLRALVAAAPYEANFRPALADILVDRGEKRLAAGQAAEAVMLADEALAAIAPLDKPTGAIEAKRCLAQAHALRGRAAKAAGDPAFTKIHLQSASEYYQAAAAGAPQNKKLREEAAAIGGLLAE